MNGEHGSVKMRVWPRVVVGTLALAGLFVCAAACGPSVQEAQVTAKAKGELSQVRRLVAFAVRMPRYVPRGYVLFDVTDNLGMQASPGAPQPRVADLYYGTSAKKQGYFLRFQVLELKGTLNVSGSEMRTVSQDGRTIETFQNSYGFVGASTRERGVTYLVQGGGTSLHTAEKVLLSIPMD